MPRVIGGALRENERELHAEEGRHGTCLAGVNNPEWIASASVDVVAVASLYFGSFEIFINPATLHGNQ